MQRIQQAPSASSNNAVAGKELTKWLMRRKLIYTGKDGVQWLRLPHSPDFKILQRRLESFNGEWPANLEPNPVVLAINGFFFKDPGTAECYQCGKCYIADGSYNEGLTVNNPADASCHEQSCQLMENRHDDTQVWVNQTIANEIERLQRKLPPYYDQVVFSVNPRRSELPNLGANGQKQQEFDKSSLACRLGSFSNWPNFLCGLETELLNSGFYYTGRGDEVECHVCGLRLVNWYPGDIPRAKHATFAPDCALVCESL